MESISLQREDKNNILVKFPPQSWAKNSLFQLTVLKHYLENNNDSKMMFMLTLDLSETYWVEAPVLLSLLTLLNNYQNLVSANIIVYSHSHKDRSQSKHLNDYLIFQSFLEKSNFLSCMPGTVKISQGDKILDVRQFTRALESFHIDGFVEAYPFIDFHICNINEYVKDGETNYIKLGLFIEELIEKGALSIRGKNANIGSLEIQRILLTANKILFEGISNSIEHAYMDVGTNVMPHFAIYSRLRRPSTSSEGVKQPTITIENELENLPVSSENFLIGTQDAWLEIFLCDLGSGVKSQLKTWISNQVAKQRIRKNDARKELIKILRKAQSRIDNNKQKHPDTLRSLGRVLFIKNVSRISDVERETDRSEQTGLQEIALVLDRAGRVIITDGVETFGGRRFDFSAHSLDSSETGTVIEKENEASRLYGNSNGSALEKIKYQVSEELCIDWLGIFDTTALSLGNIMSVYLQPGEESRIENPELIPPTSKMTLDILSVLSTEDKSLSENFILFDKRFEPIGAFTERDFSNVTKIIHSNTAHDTVNLIVRLPRLAFKNDVTSWFFLKKISSKKFTRSAKINLFFVDVNPLYAHWLIARIENFSKDRLEISPINSVSILSTTMRMWGVVKSRNDPDINFNYVPYNESKTLATWKSILKAIVAMDSEAFWSDYRFHTLNDVFKENDVVWSSSTRKRIKNTNSSEFKLPGYLEFTEALLAPERYRICQRAVFRIINLISYAIDGIPKLIVSDDMLKRIEADIAEFFKDGAETDKKCSIVLSSVVVTRGTHRRYQERWQGNIFSVCMFSRHKRDKKDEPLYSLMNWKPIRSDTTDDTVLHRISGTPFVSESGDRSIQIPSVSWNAENQKYDEHYERTRKQTYTDFLKLGVLEIGHSRHGKRHELINVDLGRALDLIKYSQHDAWKWLSRVLFNTAIDHDKAIVIVYPNTKHADKVIQWFLSDFQDQRPNNLHIIPINFLRSRNIEPLLVNPAVDEKLAKIVASSEGKSIVVRIFDSGVVTGSTIRALKQKIQSTLQAKAVKYDTEHRYISGVVPIETIALLDRSGFPMYSELMNSYKEKNLRYWRWDMPSLGTVDSCAICRAKKDIISILQPTVPIESDLASADLDLLNKIENDFVGVNAGEGGVISDNEIESLTELDVELKTVTFGNSGNQPNLIQLNSPLELIGITIERTKLLHRAEIALSRSGNFMNTGDGNIKNFRPDLSILILSTHILLFSSTFSFWERYSYALELLKVLMRYGAELNSNNRSIYLEKIDFIGALALFSLDDDLLKMLARDSRNQLRILLTDAIIVNQSFGRFLLYLEDKYDSVILESVGDINNTYYSNIDYLRGDPHLVLKKIKKVIGTHRTHHSSELQSAAIIRDIDSEKQSSSTYERAMQLLRILIRDMKQIRNVFRDKLIDELETLANEISQNSEIHTDSIKSISRLVFEEELSVLPSIARNMVPLFDLKDSLFGGSDNIFNTKKIWAKLLSDVEKHQSVSIESAWNARFGDANVDILRRSLVNDTTKEKDDCFIFVNKNCSNVIREIMLNPYHASRPILNPWGDGNNEQYALMWFELAVNENTVSLEFRNRCKISSMKTNINFIKPEKIDLYRRFRNQGYCIDWKTNDEKSLIRTVVTLPIVDWS